MSGHVASVFKHACISVPVDPVSKLPLAEFERTGMNRGTKKKQKKKYSVDSSSTDSTPQECNEVLEVSKFYKSIPDYRDVTDLSNQDFCSTLNYLRKKRRQALGCHVDVTKLYENIGYNSVVDKLSRRPFEWNYWYIDEMRARERRRQMLSRYDDVNELDDNSITKSVVDKLCSTDFQRHNWYIDEIKAREKKRQLLEYPVKVSEDVREHSLIDKVDKVESTGNTWKLDYENDIKARKSRYNSELKCRYDADDSEKEMKCYSYDSKLKKITDDIDTILNDDVITNHKAAEEKSPEKKLEHCEILSPVNKPRISSETKSKRINSACSITWDDNVVVNNSDTDDIDCKFKNYVPSSTPLPSNLRKCISLPSSPTKVRKLLFPEYKTTTTKPFKMTVRDEDHQKIQNLKCLTKSVSEEMLDRKLERKRFRANPVPIESRIPLYDKIVEEQELRRAITKINSMMDLHAQMKPFSFTKRDDVRKSMPCLRSKQSSASASTDTTKKKKKFRAKPVPKNLFSNYIYDKMREDDFYRTLNRKIRAEELLRSASLPPNMVSHGRTALGGAGAGLRARRRSRQRSNIRDGQFITTCPQPFHFDTAARAKRKETLKKIYRDRSTSVPAPISITRPLSALDIPSVNRSNLAAILRIETAKKKLEEDIQRKLAEQQFQMEMRWRDHILRKRPAWLSIKNTHEEELALRLQARREEERLRREVFLHEMELMYNRVRRQPLLFERHYEPPSRHKSSYSSQCSDMGRLSPTKRYTRKNKSQSSLGPSSSVSRKVSINETAEMINEDIFNYLDLNDEEEKTLYGSYVSPCSGGELSDKKHFE